MNERIKQLMEQAYDTVEFNYAQPQKIFNKEKFAELIVKECAERLMQDDFGSVKGVMSIAGARLKEHFGVEE